MCAINISAAANLQFAVVEHAAYFAYSRHCTCTCLLIPYVLPVISEYSSTC